MAATVGDILKHRRLAITLLSRSQTTAMGGMGTRLLTKSRVWERDSGGWRRVWLLQTAMAVGFSAV